MIAPFTIFPSQIAVFSFTLLYQGVLHNLNDRYIIQNCSSAPSDRTIFIPLLNFQGGHQNCSLFIKKMVENQRNINQILNFYTPSNLKETATTRLIFRGFVAILRYATRKGAIKLYQIKKTFFLYIALAVSIQYEECHYNTYIHIGIVKPLMRRDQNYDYLAKLLIIGDSGVGKTNILLRFCENNFMTSHLTTIGIDFKIKTIEIDGKKIRLQIWDTAGQQRFKTITQTYYKGAMGIIMVYAINDRASFNALENWMRQIKTHASENVVKVLVGNKSDCTDRQVSFEEGKKMADSFGVQFYQVSAKNNSNISETFVYMAKQIKDKVLTGDETALSRQFPKGSKITDQKAKQNAKSGCC